MNQHRMIFTAIGTRWQVDSDQEIPAPTSAAMMARIEAFDVAYSRFRPDSLVSALSRQAGTVRFPTDAAALFALYRKLYDVTDGAVTPLVGGALEHLGYDSTYTLSRRPGLSPVPAWDSVLRVEGNVLITTEPVTIDVGAAGKGFLVDLVADLLTSAGLTGFIIDAGGDMVHRGATSERVGLEDPLDASRAVGVVTVSNGALCGSATTRRSWGDGLHHIIDPGTGAPVDGTIATWATSASCAVADGMATALFLTDAARLATAFTFDYVRLSTDGSIDWSNDLPGEVFV